MPDVEIQVRLFLSEDGIMALAVMDGDGIERVAVREDDFEGELTSLEQTVSAKSREQAIEGAMQLAEKWGFHEVPTYYFHTAGFEPLPEE